MSKRRVSEEPEIDSEFDEDPAVIISDHDGTVDIKFLNY